jgi:hypothetical protein
MGRNIPPPDCDDSHRRGEKPSNCQREETGCTDMPCRGVWRNPYGSNGGD